MASPEDLTRVEHEPALKILHLFSNYKFTGPADPAMQLASAQHAAGDEVWFAAGADPAGDRDTGVRALAAGRGLPPVHDFRLPKHAKPHWVLSDVRRLRRWLREHQPDVVHCHLPTDHLTAALATRGKGPRIVRTVYDAEPPRGFRARVALASTHAVATYSPAVAQPIKARFPHVEATVVSPMLDLERFHPGDGAEWRARWELPDDAVVIGVVARMQTHRLFPELIRGFAQAAAEHPQLHMVVLGRGTNQETVAKQPARESGVGDRIHFPGYVEPDEYPRALPAFDALVFLVPGSDGTCRAAREALASGVPVIASQRGLLPTFVTDGDNGLLLHGETPEAIAHALRRVTEDPELRRTLGRLAAERARQQYTPERVYQQIAMLYRGVHPAR